MKYLFTISYVFLVLSFFSQLSKENKNTMKFKKLSKINSMIYININQWLSSIESLDINICIFFYAVADRAAQLCFSRG